MANISKKALSNIRKVSLNVNEEFIELADKIGKLTNQNRTLIFLAFIGKGVESLFRDMETTWNKTLASGNLKNNKKKKVEGLLKELKKIKSEWGKTLAQWD